MGKQKFKGKTLYTKTVVRNILAIYDLCGAPSLWYQDANKFAQSLSSSTGYDLSKVCGVIAALSPLKSWDQNKIIARSFLTGGPCKHTGVMKAKASAILKSSGSAEDIAEILKGNKIVSFFLNILRPETNNDVTIDRHALAVALGRNMKDNEQQISDKQYLFFVNCYRIAAEMRNVTPMFMQSATWEKWRELKAETKFVDVPF
jgi:hypothetical protein